MMSPKKRPTIDLVLKLLCHTLEERTRARYFFSSHAQLFKYHLMSLSEEQQERQSPFISRSLKLDDRIVDFLLGYHQDMDARLRPFDRRRNPQTGLKDIIVPGEVKEKVSHLVSRQKGDKNKTGLSPLTTAVFYLKGSLGNGQQQTADTICHELNLNLMVVDMEQMLGESMPFELSLKLIFREALLQNLAVYFKGFNRLLEEGEKKSIREALFLDAIGEFPGLIFLEGEKNWEPKFKYNSHFFFKLDFPIPPYPLRRKLWSSLLNGYPVHNNVDVNILANKFLLTEVQIVCAVQTAKSLALMRDFSNSSITIEDLYEGCRVTSNQKLAALSRKIQPRYGWGDIVLPNEKIVLLKDVCSYVRYRHVVYGDWGFDKKLSLGKGLNALFFGPSGTGKTMAAEVIAKDLGLDLYKIDLSCVVSKYIGETEKNLSRIFKEAETSNSILFFDEADALFGKRSEVKDAHDRYANIEVGYLLQKMEEYEWIVILATNFMKNMDDAFVRRMHFQVEFPFPDEEHRLKIWKTIFPRETPRDENIDFDFLARKFKIAGGNIKNIVLSAAFLAAENSGKIGMKHIIMSTKREFQKIGRLSIESDFGKYYSLSFEK